MAAFTSLVPAQGRTSTEKFTYTRPTATRKTWTWIVNRNGKRRRVLR
jgi:hypothetical protein